MAQTVTTKAYQINDELFMHHISWQADAAGAFADTALDHPINGRILLVDTAPGGTAPDDNYDIDLLNAEGVDVMGGALDNRDDTLTERVQPEVAGVTYEAPVRGCLTLNISGNAVNDSQGNIFIYFKGDESAIG